jgi:DNA (cytosine-5)-methyltransferase 1
LWKRKKENVFSQLLCTLVGLGYQVQQFLIDAWSTGDAQSRSRIFIAATAPNLIPMQYPYLTHCHPPQTNTRKLGVAANGQAFGERRFDITPFQYVSAVEDTKDIPDIGNGEVEVCVSRCLYIRIGIAYSFPSAFPPLTIDRRFLSNHSSGS